MFEIYHENQKKDIENKIKEISLKLIIYTKEKIDIIKNNKIKKLNDN